MLIENDVEIETGAAISSAIGLVPAVPVLCRLTYIYGLCCGCFFFCRCDVVVLRRRRGRGHGSAGKDVMMPHNAMKL